MHVIIIFTIFKYIFFCLLSYYDRNVWPVKEVNGGGYQIHAITIPDNSEWRASMPGGDPFREGQIVC